MDTQKREDLLWCGLTLALTILVRGLMFGLLPHLTTSDAGRDLYGFWMVLEGKTPCRDFWWEYGPLMPLYYAFWFLLGGVHLISLQVGLDMIYVAMAFASFWTLRLFVPPPAALLTSLVYLTYDYTSTFNHIGCFPFLLLGIFFLWKFFLTSRIRWCYLGTLAMAGVTLVKISVGPPFFLAFLISILSFNLLSYLRKEKKFSDLGWKHMLFFLLIFGFLAGGGYLLMYRGLPLSWLDQCLTLSPTYRVSRDYSPWDNVKNVVMLFLFWRPQRLIWTAGYLALALLALRYFKKQNLSAKERQTNWAAAGSLALFFLAGLSDYIIMGEVAQVRVSLWTYPILILLMGLLGGWAVSIFSQPKRILIYFLVFLWVMGVPLGVMGDRPYLTVSDVFQWRTPERYLDFPHGRAFVGGGPLYNQWNQIIKQVTQYLIENTGPSEKILAVPYEPLFCFLSGRRHAIWQLKLDDNHRIPEPYEDEIIRILEREHIRYVIQTNADPFGNINLKRLARYIFDHYEVVKTFGVWEEKPPYTSGAKIFRRKNLK